MGFLSSLFNKLTGGIPCPACGTPGAQKEGDRIRCLNPMCSNFDTARGGSSAAPPSPTSARPTAPTGYSAPQGFSSQPARPGSVAIQYRNYQGESRTFQAEIASLKRTRNHISAKVAPKGRMITLSRDRIQNLSEIDPLLPARDRSGVERPRGRDLRVLNYHKKYGTTSPLYEKIKAKYPEW